jgi:hypothetical protein
MSRQVLVAHYGPEPIALKNHNPLFDLMTGSRRRDTAGVRNEDLKATITFAVSRSIARCITLQPHELGWRLLRYHKQQLCWYAVSQVRLKGKGAAMPAIRDWLALHQVEEEHYGLETAYKLWQRFGLNFHRKNAFFSARLRRNSSGRKEGERANFRPLELRRHNSFDDIVLGLRARSFVQEYQAKFKSLPKSLHKHITVYLIVHRQYLSQNATAAKLEITRYNVRTALAAIDRRAERNRAFAALLQHALALP